MIDYTSIDSQANNCIQWIKTYFDNLNKKKAIIGISGGKDSTVTAMLCVRALGKENVIGVLMPNGKQNDIADSMKVVETLGIEHYTLNIEAAFNGIINEVTTQVGTPSEDTKINTPARLRMTMLYALSPMFDALVANTCNLSEDTVGYATLYGDSAGSFAPLSQLTTEEIIAIGDYLTQDLKVPTELIHKTPIDGLQPKSDEEKLGFTYHEVNELIRKGVKGKNYDKIKSMCVKNKFKTDIIRIPCYIPSPALPNYNISPIGSLL